MSRLYIALFYTLLALPYSLSGQVKLKDLVNFADEQFKKGDYYYAIDYYEKALAIDSNSLELKWKYAQTLRAYKNYKEAEKAYADIYAREEAEKYPESILYLGLMQKQNGKYQLALETFKLAKSLYDDIDSYNYKKSNKEIESCYWALKNKKDTTDLSQFNQRINSFDAEFGHHYDRSKLIFSSLRADSTNENEEVYGRHYSTSLYQINASSDSLSKPIKIIGLTAEKTSIGNASYSSDQHFFYFSICEDEGYNYRCKIARAMVKDGKYGKVDTLGEQINYPNSNTTTPMVVELDGKPYLFFASNRAGTKGEMDIWYSEIISDSQFGPAVNVSAINSIDNEICPWYDSIKNQLYFSSTWHNGFGGYDVFSAKRIGSKFEKPINRNQPINSPANDLYYFEAGDSLFVSSNRIGSLSKKNPTCCSDIFFSKIERPQPPDSTSIIITKRLNFPIVLFFKNDRPDPKSTLPTSALSYEDTYLEYTSSFNEYMTRVNGDSTLIKNERSEKLDSFFANSVVKGYNDLLELSDSLALYLAGNKYVTLFIKGYASPLHQTNYNVNLSKRRINTYYNYLSRYKNGLFQDALKQTNNKVPQIRIIEIPFGEYAANQLTSDDLNDQKNSVYSYEAGIERKIEILGIEASNERPDSIIQLMPSIIYLEKMSKSELTFTLENQMASDVVLEKIELNSALFEVIDAPTTISSNGKSKLKLNFTPPKEKGFYLYTIDVKFLNIANPIRGFASIEIK